MSARARLEAELKQPKGMTYDNLVVYADVLQSDGDPRGELISLDLVAPKNPYSDGAVAWRQRRHAVLVEWVGSAVAEEVAEHVDLGFVKTLDERASDALLDSPAGEFIRGFTLDITGTPTTPAMARAKLAKLASRTRPWLQRLDLRGSSWGTESLVDGDLADALIAATPMLVRLGVGGAVTVERFPHPTMRALALDNATALVAFDAAMPGVVILDLKLRPTREQYPLDGFELSPAMFPALDTLDLRRCVDDQDPVFALIEQQTIAKQIQFIDLPALESTEAARSAGRMLDQMSVKRARIARTYGGAIFGADLANRVPPIEIPTPFPWPAPSSLKAYNSLIFQIPEEPFNDIVALPTLLAFLEANFEAFAPAARAAWSQIWDAIRPTDEPQFDDEGEWIQPPPRQDITLATLTLAVDACAALTSSESRSWSEFRAHFRHAVTGMDGKTVIGISIYRG